MQACEDCGENPATVHLTQIMNDATIISHLCEQCAKNKGVTIIIQEPLLPNAGLEEAARDVSCSSCAMNFSEFKLTGLLGCKDCYTNFAEEIDAILLQVHGSLTHQGKPYKNSITTPLATLPKLPDIKKLRRDLAFAIENEEFEHAAHIRDAINSSEILNSPNA